MSSCNRNYDKAYDECETDEIKNLLMFHKIMKVVDDTLVLDNGTELTVEANEGCGGCSSGWYSITELNECNNVITNVEFDCDDCDNGEDDTSYKIFVYAEDKHIKILQVDGNDGNGYYGTGYTIYVKFKKSE